MTNGRPSDPDRADGKRAWTLAAGIALVLAVVGAAAFFAPALVATHLSPGVGLKTASAIGFGVTFVVFVVFAVTAGDGVIGELPVMLAAFLFFWAIFSTSVAWIF